MPYSLPTRLQEGQLALLKKPKGVRIIETEGNRSEGWGQEQQSLQVTKFWEEQRRPRGCGQQGVGRESTDWDGG